jgi:hypothetical protein
MQTAYLLNFSRFLPPRGDSREYAMQMRLAETLGLPIATCEQTIVLGISN